MRKLPKKIQDAITYSYPGDRFVKRPKYSNVSAQCWNKQHAVHASILEADLCNQLNIMKKTREIQSYVTQYKIELIVEGQRIANHYVDFCVSYAHGRVEFWEAKGYPTQEWELKRKLTRALYPDIPYIVKYEKPTFWKGKK